MVRSRTRNSRLHLQCDGFPRRIVCGPPPPAGSLPKETPFPLLQERGRGFCVRARLTVMALPQIPRTDLLGIVQEKSGEQVTDEQLSTALFELLAWVNAGPAKCRTDWNGWDDLPGEVQGILLGTIGRMLSGAAGNIVQERIGDYSVQYADSALFEGRHPTLLLDSEEVAISRIAGCGGSLSSVTTNGVEVIGSDALKDSLIARAHAARDKVGF